MNDNVSQTHPYHDAERRKLIWEEDSAVLRRGDSMRRLREQEKQNKTS